MGDGEGSPDLVPRLCHIVRWSDFNGYGFNLHAEKGKAGQFIGKVDEGSPAEAAGLKQGDRIVEVNGVNIGNENHQQVVSRIKAGGEETRLLVVDNETDAFYKDEKKIVRGDLPEVKFLTAARDEDEPSAVIGSVHNGMSGADMDEQYPPRLCHLCKWADFDGYGFNLHAEKDKPGQFIGSVDPESPAEVGGLREGDRIIEVNGENIEKESHTSVIQRIKAGGERTSMLVLDRGSDDYYKNRGVTVSSSMPHVIVFNVQPRGGGRSSQPNGRNAYEEPEPARVVVPEPVREPVRQPEPEAEPAVIKSTMSTMSKPASEGDPIMSLSAAEMKERLRAKKKQDPRLQRTSFEAKHKMFERM